MLLSSDPHAWLRPFYMTLKADPAFNTLAIPLRFMALCELVAMEQHDRAPQMRDWSPAAQVGILNWLDSVTKRKRVVNETELWSVTKGERKLRCYARHLPNGDRPSPDGR